MKRLPHALFFVAVAVAWACAHARIPPSAGYGLSRTQAVEVCLPSGEAAYIKALRCARGDPVRSERLGPVGTRTQMPNASGPRALEQMDPAAPLRPGEPDLHIVDAFRLDCGPTALTIYLDMYHCGSAPPEDAPDGLKFDSQGP